MPIILVQAALFVLASVAYSGDVKIHMERGRFTVMGWSAPSVAPENGWSSVFRVYAGDGEVPPMLGAYSVENGLLTFVPRFNLSPGVNVRAVFLPASVEAAFRIPRNDARPTTYIDHVYPSVNVIPANQLKFYIEFTAPMQRGIAWQHIKLVGEDGRPVELPFIEIDQELWDASARRLTVLFDPGRIKRGVLPLEEVGPAIEEGKRYKLLIDEEWLDANGQKLVRPFVKEFSVVTEDRTPIDVQAWRVSPPAHNTLEPVRVEFPEPLDHALLGRLITVANGKGQVKGTVHIERNETQWLFTPTQPWTGDAYSLRVDTALEDLAGNKVGRPFDVDTFEPVTRRVNREIVSVPFRVRRK